MMTLSVRLLGFREAFRSCYVFARSVYFVNFLVWPFAPFSMGRLLFTASLGERFVFKGVNSRLSHGARVFL